MKEEWMRTFELWGRTEWFRARVREAERVIEERGITNVFP